MAQSDNANSPVFNKLSVVYDYRPKWLRLFTHPSKCSRKPKHYKSSQIIVFKIMTQGDNYLKRSFRQKYHLQYHAQCYKVYKTNQFQRGRLGKLGWFGSILHICCQTSHSCDSISDSYNILCTFSTKQMLICPWLTATTYRQHQIVRTFKYNTFQHFYTTTQASFVNVLSVWQKQS